MRQVSYEHTYGRADMMMYAELMARDNGEQMGRLRRNLAQALYRDITPCQREYLNLYYGKCMTMTEIARQKGVNKSTVSRTLRRGRERLFRCLRYGASNLLEQSDS